MLCRISLGANRHKQKPIPEYPTTLYTIKKYMTAEQKIKKEWQDYKYNNMLLELKDRPLKNIETVEEYYKRHDILDQVQKESIIEYGYHNDGRILKVKKQARLPLSQGMYNFLKTILSAPKQLLP